MSWTVKQLAKFRLRWHGQLVVTNGCFDLVHLGHIRLLQYARRFGDMLIVGLNGDESVRQLKGEGRPINNVKDRAELLSAIRFVDQVCIFNGVRCVDFLLAAKPDVYVKGPDYTLKTLDPSERAALRGVLIEFAPRSRGFSTTKLLHRLC